jgi:hypothetical protein
VADLGFQLVVLSYAAVITEAMPPQATYCAHLSTTFSLSLSRSSTSCVCAQLLAWGSLLYWSPNHVPRIDCLPATGCLPWVTSPDCC